MSTLRRMMLLAVMSLGTVGPGCTSAADQDRPSASIATSMPTADEVFPETGLEIRADGAVRISEPPGRASDQNPAFSPDGALILFTRFDNGYNSGPAGMYLLDLATGQIRPLFWEDDQDAVNMPGSGWNSETGRIAFASDRVEHEEVWTMTAEGDGLFQVTHDILGLSAAEPTFSPNGEWIVFQVVDFNAPEDAQGGSIWKIRRDSSELTQLTQGPAGGYDDRQPNWAPAGDRIVFQRRELDAETWDLYSMAADGTGLEQVTTDPSDDTDASWSPDGQWIVYSSNYGGLPVPNLFVIAAGGGEPVRVTRSGERYDGAVSWSPDGRWIAFESSIGDDAPTALWIIAAPDFLP